MENFDYSNFDKIYDTKIYPELAPLEKERKLLLIKGAVCVFATVITYIIATVLSNELCYKITGGLWVILFTYMFFQIMQYKQNIKNKLYRRLFKSLGFQYSSGKKSEREISLICANSNIFNRYDFVESDDKITGRYKDLPFTALDTYIYYETRDLKGRKTQHPIFKGIVLSTRINKPLNCEILIKTDRLLQSKEIKNKKVVRLEDPEFEKHFEVYATDQVEARYILTTAFMNRLLNYKKVKRKTVEVALMNDVTTDNVFFFIRTNRDNFEVPIFRSILNKQVFLNILKELTDALDVINELKLEQNIGM